MASFWVLKQIETNVENSFFYTSVPNLYHGGLQL